MLVVVLFGALAHADVVGPEPSSCPSGSEPRANHFASYCAPTTCDVESSCPDGECRPIGLCIISQSGQYDMYEEPVTWREASRTCDSDADCSDGAECIVEERCAAAGCGCRAVPRSGAALGLIGLLGLVGFVRRGRRSGDAVV